MSTASETILALEKALEAGPTPGVWSQEHRMGFEGFWNTEVFDAAGTAIATLNWLPRPTVDGVTGTYREANAQWIAAANPLAIRTLLDAHASALRANAELLDQMHHFANADQRLWDEGQRDPESFKSWVRSRAAHLLVKFNKPAALDDNTKGAR